MAKRYEGQVVQARRAQAVLAGVDTTFAQPTVGVHAEATGTLTCLFENDVSVVSMNVVAGQTYPYAIISVPVGNAVNLVALF